VKFENMSYFCFIIIKKIKMLDFSQFSGLVLFMFVFTAGFWLLIFLLTFVVPYWIGGTIWENLKLKKEAKQAAKGK
jgi:hypothetical protein